uniref:Secreted protein n=1 Tax=Steinernema glaseri TaxID=37863 RepID=A0A1I7ZEZ0_9BILA
MAHSGILSSLRPLSLLFLFIPLVYSDQQERHGEPSSLTRTTRNSQNEIITDDRYEELQESLRAIAKDVDALLPIDTVTSIADLIAYCAETQITKDVPENLRKIQKLVLDGFANMERSSSSMDSRTWRGRSTTPLIHWNASSPSRPTTITITI